MHTVCIIKFSLETAIFRIILCTIETVGMKDSSSSSSDTADDGEQMREEELLVPFLLKKKKRRWWIRPLFRWAFALLFLLSLASPFFQKLKFST